MTDDVDELELSVRACNLLQNAGIRTISRLRKFTDDDLKVIGFNAKGIKEIREVLAERPPLTKEQLVALEAKESKERLVAARAVFSGLSTTERATIFREFAQCACASVGTALKNPAVGVGALAGAVIGAIFFPKREPTAKPIAYCGSCFHCVMSGRASTSAKALSVDSKPCAAWDGK